MASLGRCVGVRDQRPRGRATDDAVRVWQGSIQIPTYAEDAPNPNPPFDLFSFGRFNYPYPLRDGLTTRRETVSWRSLHLENEYLRVTVLPDLGGHLYSCLDKRTGREMFYANTAIKKALIGYRGAWAAFGIEFNFPVSHNWMSMSPVDFAIRAECRWERIDLGREQGSGLRVAVARRIASPARPARPRRTRRAVQLERRAAPLLLVDQRRGAGVGGLAARLSDRADGDARLHERRALAHRSRGPRPQCDSQSDRRSRLALHLQDARTVRRRLPSAHQQRHGAPSRIRRSCRSTRCGPGATIAKPPRGGRRSRTTTADMSSCRLGCFAIRRRTPSSSRRRRCASPSTGCRFAISAGSPARTSMRCSTWIVPRRRA